MVHTTDLEIGQIAFFSSFLSPLIPNKKDTAMLPSCYCYVLSLYP